MADVRARVASTRLARRAARLLGYWRSESRTLRQGLVALILSTFAGFVAGLTLASFDDALRRMPGLLVLIPASVVMRGMIFGSMGARLGTQVAAGVFEPNLRRGGPLRTNIEVAIVSALVMSFYLAVAAKLVASAFGEETVSLWDLVTVSVLGGTAASGILLVLTVALARASFHRGWDLDAVSPPVVTMVGGKKAVVHAGKTAWAYVLDAATGKLLDYALLSPSEIRDKYPLMEMDDIVGGLWDAHDGDIDPSQLTQALAKGAKDMGAKVLRFNGVSAIKQLPSGEWKITTKDGTEFVAEKVINAAGYRAGEVAAMVGQYLPIIAMQHQYLITEMIPELAARKEKLPLVRDPDVSYYLRQERDGLILGPYEWNCNSEWHDGIPKEFAFARGART